MDKPTTNKETSETNRPVFALIFQIYNSVISLPDNTKWKININLISKMQQLRRHY